MTAGADAQMAELDSPGTSIRPNDPSRIADDAEFDQIYEFLPSGLIVATCTAQSFEMSVPVHEKILTSFCLSVKRAGSRSGSNAIDVKWDYSRRQWKLRGVAQLQAAIEEYRAKNVRIFLLNRPADTAIDRHIAELIHKSSLARSVS